MYIKRIDKEDNNYFHLQQQSLEILQKLSGKLWTDFNEHDPGVTIMDILNYNLLELIYQTEFDFEKYLTHPDLDELTFSQVGLLPANEIFAPCIVTLDDYEELIIKEVTGVKNCEIKLVSEGYYQILIDKEEEAEAEVIINDVRVLYHRYRNLGENLREVILKKLPRRKNKKQLTSIEYNQKAEKTEARNAFTQLHISLQYDFPDTYGINRQGLPAHASEHRKAQALQLKGYLLIFDYLLSATKQQLGGLHQMLSLSERILPPFSEQIQANDLDQLLDLEKLQQTEIFNKKDLHRQKSAYLDMLDALYGEDTRFIGLNTSFSLEEINRRRAKLIQQFPALNTNRFRSFNILDSTDQSVIKQTIGYIMGVNIHQEIPITNLFAHHRLQLIDDDTFFAKYKQILSINIVENVDSDPLECISPTDIAYQESEYEKIYIRINLLWYNILYQSFLSNGSDVNNYRMINHGNKGYLLAFKTPERRGWLLLGQFYEKEELTEITNLFCQFIKYLNTQTQNFYLIEHILLDTPKNGSQDNNKLSIIYPQWSDNFSQKECQERIKERLPIHIEVRFVGLPMQKMVEFEQHYDSWRKALASGIETQIRMYTEYIKRLIIGHQE